MFHDPQKKNQLKNRFYLKGCMSGDEIPRLMMMVDEDDDVDNDEAE